MNIDPEGVRELLLLVERLRSDQGVTVLLSSHLLHQVSRCATASASSSPAGCVACGTVDELAGDARRPLGVHRRRQPTSTTPARVLEVARASRASTAREGRWTVHADRDVRDDAARRVSRPAARFTHLSRDGADLDAIYHRYFAGEAPTAGRYAVTRRPPPTADDAPTRRRPIDQVPRRLAHRRPQGVHRPRPLGPLRDPGRARVARRAGVGALGERADPRRRRLGHADAVDLPLPVHAVAPDACRRSTSSSASSGRCSASPSGSTRSTASGPSARCRGWSRSRSTATRSSTASSSPASAPSPWPWRASMAIVGGYGALRLGIGPTLERPGADLRLLRRRRRLHRAVAGAVAAAVGRLPAGRHRGAWRRSRSGSCCTLFVGLIAGVIADTVAQRDGRLDDRAGARQRPPRAATCGASRPTSSTRTRPACCSTRRGQSTGIVRRHERHGGACRPACRSSQPAAGVVAARRADRRRPSCCSRPPTSSFMRQEVRA